MFFISIVKQYERGVIFRLGKYIGTRDPGLVILIPFIDRGVKVDMREFVLDEPAQTSITKDNALVDIDFVVYMQVVGAEAAVINIQSFVNAVRNLATTTLRAVIGEMSVEEVLSKREEINHRLQVKMSEEVVRWGVQVNAVEIRGMEPQRDIQEAMTRLLTADRTKRSQITESEGERQAAINVAEGQQAGGDPRGRGRTRGANPARRGLAPGPDPGGGWLLRGTSARLRDGARGRLQHHGSPVPGDDEAPG